MEERTFQVPPRRPRKAVIRGQQVAVSVYLPPAVYEALVKAAEESGESLTRECVVRLRMSVERERELALLARAS